MLMYWLSPSLHQSLCSMIGCRFDNKPVHGPAIVLDFMLQLWMIPY